ncbi:MAG: hypothetical protein RIF46_11905 [Cyclobacteriaceae bacterium]
MRIAILLGLLIGFKATSQIPPTLVTERSIVILDLPLEKKGEFLVRGNWKEQATKIQSNLSIMGIDAIGYLHIDDWEASQSSKESYQLFFAQRMVKHRILVSKNASSLFELSIMPLTKNEIEWKTEAGSINQAFLRLGQDIKKAGHPIENFLSPTNAEIFVDIPFTKYSASTNYPDQIRRLTLGVARHPNEKDNEKLVEIMSDYPFQYELFDYTDDDDAFRQGYQYILVSMSTSGSSVKKLLNFRTTGSNETDYISTVKGDSTDTRLKTIPVNALVHKYYFRQTVNHEVFVGKEWDADVSWEKSLENFILNLRIAFKRI